LFELVVCFGIADSRRRKRTKLCVEARSHEVEAARGKFESQDGREIPGCVFCSNGSAQPIVRPGLPYWYRTELVERILFGSAMVHRCLALANICGSPNRSGGTSL
jgi:hypothetical protein